MKKNFFQPIKKGIVKNAYADWPKNLFTLTRLAIAASEIYSDNSAWPPPMYMMPLEIYENYSHYLSGVIDDL